MVNRATSSPAREREREGGRKARARADEGERLRGLSSRREDYQTVFQLSPALLLGPIPLRTRRCRRGDESAHPRNSRLILRFPDCARNTRFLSLSPLLELTNIIHATSRKKQYKFLQFILYKKKKQKQRDYNNSTRKHFCARAIRKKIPVSVFFFFFYSREREIVFRANQREISEYNFIAVSSLPDSPREYILSISFRANSHVELQLQIVPPDEKKLVEGGGAHVYIYI